MRGKLGAKAPVMVKVGEVILEWTGNSFYTDKNFLVLLQLIVVVYGHE